MIFEKNKNKLKILYITLKETKNIIKKMKISNLMGHDCASIKIYKKLVDQSSPMLMHLINLIILSSTYPEILKISMLLPTFKTNKNPLDPEFYRPINNLCTLDKIIEQYLKSHIQTHPDSNNIIHKHHHGSRKNHGTHTTLAQINYEISRRYDDGFKHGI